MPTLKKIFEKPNNEVLPRLRFWWPGGYVAHHLDELDHEMAEIARAGFGGVEIADVYDAISEEDCQTLQPDIYGFTSQNWKTAIKQALLSAKKYDLKVDLTVGPHWPASTNEATPNQVGTAKELVYGTFLFKGTLDAGQKISDLCPPHYQTSAQQIDGSPIDNTLIAVYVAAHIDHKDIEMPPPVPWEKPYTVISDEIDFDTLKELQLEIKDGYLQADIEGPSKENILIAIYQRGTGQRVNMFSMGSPNRPDVMDPFAYVVDHFSKDGAELIKSLWKKHFLTDHEFVSLLQEVGDCFFEDSLELQSVGHWTENMLSEFQKRMKYDIRPYLPFVLGINQDKGLGMSQASFQVSAEYQPKIKQFRHDYFLVLNQLYQEYHLQVIKEWAHSLGMKYRAQPYGWAIDSAAAAAQLDIVEGESLGFGENGNDAFRMLAAGRDFGGQMILSDEAGAYLFQGYATTLTQLLQTLHKNYMAGVNQTYWHGTAFKYAPGAKWPGFAAFNPMLGGRGFAEPWGERQPVWQFLPLYTSYLGRVHHLLRYGKNQIDILVYQEGHNASENKILPCGTELNRLGYRYQVMTEGLFGLETNVEDGDLVTKGACYRGLLLSKSDSLTEEQKKIIEEWEAQGLPIFVQEDLETSSMTDRVSPFLTNTNEGDIVTYRRSDAQHDFLFVYNAGSKSLSLDSLFESRELEEWCCWTGKVTQTNRTQLHGGELRVFDLKNNDGVKLSQTLTRQTDLTEQSWDLVIEKWEMSASDQIDILKSQVSLSLPSLDFWTNLKDLDSVSGIGVYQTTYYSESKKSFTLEILQCSGSLSVAVNKKPILGNPITGIYTIDEEIVEKENVIEITVGSTLNNYLNVSQLAEHYGELPPQDYGIKKVVIEEVIDM